MLNLYQEFHSEELVDNTHERLYHVVQRIGFDRFYIRAIGIDRNDMVDLSDRVNDDHNTTITRVIFKNRHGNLHFVNNMDHCIRSLKNEF